MHRNNEETILNLSREKWLWMSECQSDKLDALFHDKAVFVHMGATMSKIEELEVIRSGRIHYKKADIQSESVRLIDKTAIVLVTMQLDAVVGGEEVTNPFTVTEVYVELGEDWKLASVSFTKRIIR